ncbi:hypothetical protein [Aeromonas tecta]|uniref:hypothetical protein n=1 Tax=Aeromonas tecta TaxID=324617 RepID=UPI00068284F3|nr:hypothetical protein [Aeromonas tecta]
MLSTRYLLPLLASLLWGCGPELAGTAATTGALQAEQAKAQMDEFQQALSAAVDATQVAASAAATTAK